MDSVKRFILQSKRYIYIYIYIYVYTVAQSSKFLTFILSSVSGNTAYKFLHLIIPILLYESVQRRSGKI